MDDVVYRSKEYIIIRKKSNKKLGFVVINTRKDFKQGHTHVMNYNTAKTLISLSKNNTLPKSHNEYFINSLIRISRDSVYIEKLKNIL